MTDHGGRWFAQPVPSLGAITSEGIKNPLGRPAMDRLTVLVREAAQNSWDARPEGRESGVYFGLDLRSVAVEGAWRELLLDAPDPRHLPLKAVLDADTMDVLFVSDRGTQGLGGPTRGGRDPGRRKDYLSFVLNVGVPRDREGGGGTFGYGKASLFNCSRAQAILVHTHAAAGDGYSAESRFIGIGLGTSHVSGGREYTGRYWWGLIEGDDHVEPLRGEAADDLARQLGFPSFAAGETGTTIAILGSDMDGRSRAEQAERLASAISWHLWPKLVTGEMEFNVMVDGVGVRVPGPDDDPVIAHFASVFAALPDGKPITRGGKELGRLNIQTSFAAKPVIDDVGCEAGLVGGVHHVCLMRGANLVVEYIAGDPLPDEDLWYAGVFRADSDPTIDAAFAAAEPPTHDTWEPAQLEDEPRKIVRHALRRIREELRAYVVPKATDGDSQSTDGSLGALSAELGGLLAPSVGGGASASGESAAPPGRRSVISMSGPPRWERLDGEDVLVQDFQYDGTRRCTVEAKLRVMLWGGAGESDGPLGARTPTFLHWRRSDGTQIADRSLVLQRADAGSWSAVVRPVEETVTSILIREARRSGS